jgi:hypothetical protein
VLAGDVSQLLRCEVLAISSSYGHGVERRTHLGRYRAAGSTETQRVMTRFFSMSSVMSVGRPKGWNEPGKAQTGVERHP